MIIDILNVTGEIIDIAETDTYIICLSNDIVGKLEDCFIEASGDLL